MLAQPKESPLSACRLQVCWCTAFALVLLRLAIGWHFASEGVKHLQEPGWTSEGLLRQAKGPFAAKFTSLLPTMHGWQDVVDRKSLGPAKETEKASEPAATPTDEVEAAKPPSPAKAHADGEAFDASFKQFRGLFNDFDKLLPEQLETAHSVVAWYANVQSAWRRHTQELTRHYGLDAEQKARASEITEERLQALLEWLAGNFEAIAAHVHESTRWSNAAKAKSAADVPYQKRRIAENRAKLGAEAAGWMSKLRGMERDLHQDLHDLLSEAQKAKPTMPADLTPLRQVDAVLKYFIFGVGVLLLTGLFTRLAALAGAGFLLSVCVQQPFWLPDAQPTYNQIVEFAALLTLVTVPSGRWGGLDFLLHAVFKRCCGRAPTADIGRA